MDLLQSCMDVLRLLARQPDTPDRLRLAEIRINEYLGPDAAALHSLLERLAEAVRVEGQQHPSEGTFWSVVRVYVVLWLSRLPSPDCALAPKLSMPSCRHDADIRVPPGETALV